MIKLSLVLVIVSFTFSNAQKIAPWSEGEWYPIPIENKNSGSHYVDWSSLLDAPAGKHGFIKVVNGTFRFEDGTPTSFYGINTTASINFLDKIEADSLAKRFSMMGCNLVRLHMLDAVWSSPNVFGNLEGTRSLNPEAMDRLDFFIHCLKKRGIYVFLDILVHRQFVKADGIYEPLPDAGGKSIAFFDPKIIFLQKEFARQLLEHKNKYTRFAYKNDPVIVGCEFINESTVFMHFEGDIVKKSPYYQKELEDMFKKAGYNGTLASFKMQFGKQTQMINTREGADVNGSIKFLSELEDIYYSEMYRFYKDSIGVKFPISGTNFPYAILADMEKRAKLDFNISNTYWDHPQVWNIGNDWSRVLYAPIDNNTQLKSPNYTQVQSMVSSRSLGKPFMITEWNHCYPNEFMVESMPFVAAYSKLQGWEGLIQYNFDKNDPPGTAKLANAFDVSKMPEHLANWVMAAPLYLRGDIKTAPSIVVNKISKEQFSSLPNTSDFLGENNHLPYVTKIAYAYEGQEDSYKDFLTNISDPKKFDKYRNGNTFNSETGELKTDMTKGIFEINTSRLQGACGSLKDVIFSFPALSFKIENSSASIFMISKDGKDLGETKNFYLVVAGPTRLTGQKFNKDRTAQEEVGELPLLAQIIKGYAVFNTITEINKIVVTPLSMSGEKLAPLNITKSSSGFASIDLSKGRSFVYEVIIK